jgi:hypothetical protein
MDATRADAWAGMADALIARARFQRSQQAETQPALTQARSFIERALAIEAALVPPVRYRVMIAELDAEALLDRHADPGPAVMRMRADVQLLLRRLPDDGFAHRFWCRAELIAARWALAHHEPADPLVARAVSEAARARQRDAMDALAWTASAEAELVRAEAASAHKLPSSTAIASGLAFIEQAMKIDPALVRTLTVRDRLARSAARPVLPHGSPADRSLP